MNAQELRSGNWLHSELTNKDFQVNPDDIRSIWLGYDGGMVKQIPLTEERLLKFGFKHTFGGQYEYKNIMLSVGIDHAKVFFENHFIKDIQYVHQLQNLYFSLTGEELTLPQS